MKLARIRNTRTISYLFNRRDLIRENDVSEKYPISVNLKLHLYSIRGRIMRKHFRILSVLRHVKYSFRRTSSAAGNYNRRTRRARYRSEKDETVA